MQFRALALLPLLPLIHAAPASRDDPSAFEVSEVTLFHGSGRPGNVNNYVVRFRVHDLHAPDPTLFATCEATWPMATPDDWPAAFVPCIDDDAGAAFEWKFNRFDGLSDFNLEFKHTYDDPSVGTPSTVQAFAKKDVTAGPTEDLQCVGGASGVFSCWLRDDIPLLLPIYAMIA